MLAVNIKRVLRLRLWLLERFRLGETGVTLFWAGVVGLCGGLLSVAFLHCIYFLQRVLTAHAEEELITVAAALPPWLRVAIPTVGGLLAGAVLIVGRRLVKSAKSTTNYMEAVLVGNGVIRLRDTLSRVFSSLFSIASGGSIGREGAMVTLSSTFASWLGRRRGVSTPRLRLLVACGAAAGIAAAYRTPFAGALFVSEIILGSIAMETYGALAISSLASTLVVYQLIGTEPTYTMPTAFHVGSNWDYPLFLLLGILAGMFSPVFLRALRASGGLFAKWKVSVMWKLAVGGLIVGLISVYEPKVWGNGFGVVDGFLRDESLVWSAVLMVFVCKFFATSASVGSGAVGGVFTPTLFMGAAVGWLFGYLMNAVFPALSIPPAGFALVGMGCMLAASTQAVLMSILMIFEMSLQYEVVLPLMLGCVTAYFVAKSLGQESIYAAHLQRKEDAAKLLNSRAVLVKDLMRKDPPCVRETTSFGKIAQLFVGYRLNRLYVIDKNRKFLGAVSLHEMKPFLNDANISRTVLAADFMRDDFPVLTPEQNPGEALQAFLTIDGERIPVVNNLRERTLLGYISKTDLLLTLAAK